ncbi:MAG TPA: universal stress protein [Candidatus Acidoferrales bacterium]|nr:universal stress protein [Candidatus Acidoferrales bacterium]
MGRNNAKARVSLKNLLFATDFSRYSSAALPYALSIAHKYRSKIFAVHVVSLAPAPDIPPAGPGKPAIAEAVSEAKQAMASLKPQWRGIRHQTLIRKGDIWNELSKVIHEKKIDLVVTGTHGRRGVSKALLGSVAEKVFRHAGCPVLTLGPNVSGEPESIADIHAVLYPTDFTPHSLAALPYAISLAQENLAHLYLLHVMASGEDLALVASFESLLRELVPRATELWCEPKVYVEPGGPAEKILEMAEELEVDLIVLGTKRQPEVPSPIHPPLAAAYRVVTEAICPVMTIPARSREVLARSAAD